MLRALRRRATCRSPSSRWRGRCRRTPTSPRAIVDAGHEIAGHGLRWISYQDGRRPTPSGRTWPRRCASSPSSPARRRSAGTPAATRPTPGGSSSSTAASSTTPTPTPTTCPTGSTSTGTPTSSCRTRSTPTTCASPPPQGFNSGDQFFAYCRDAFDVLYAEGATQPEDAVDRAARPASSADRRRFAALQRLLDHVTAHDDVWVCRRVDIARHWVDDVPAAGRPATDSTHGDLLEPFDPPARLLMGPGPINADPRVLRAMSAPLIGQFDPAMTGAMNRDDGPLPRGVPHRQRRRRFLVDGTARAGIEAMLVSLHRARRPRARSRLRSLRPPARWRSPAAAAPRCHARRRAVGLRSFPLEQIEEAIERVPSRCWWRRCRATRRRRCASRSTALGERLPARGRAALRRRDRVDRRQRVRDGRAGASTWPAPGCRSAWPARRAARR